LEYLTNIDSCSDDPEGVAKVADFFAEGFREMGWNVTEHDFAPKTGPCLICTNREADHYDLMLIGHLDTVFPKGTCAEWPFRIEGNVAYGPGVSDMKNGSLLMYHLMRDLPAELNEKLNIVVVFNPDEEIGSHSSRPLYAPYAEKCDYAFLYESGGTNGTLCNQRKGCVGITAEFIGKAGHCGYVFENGAKSAVSEMARWIVALDALQSRERNTTVNVGVARGGTKTNVVADHARIQVSIRFSAPDEVERVKALVDKLTAESEERGIGVNMISYTSSHALNPTEEGKKYFEHITEVCKSEGLEISFKARGGLSDANLIAPYGPICLDGLGPIGDDCHSRDEYLLIDSVMPFYKLSQVLIKALADNKK
ncbi:MAG: M20 family metallopeptidase, partial [Clostridia bacterium]|nr:M20 family metallopeptidase [Clostridia bacterium]